MKEGLIGPHDLIEFIEGDALVIISAPHGGKEVPPELKAYERGDRKKIDIYTDLLAREILEEARLLGKSFPALIARGRRSLLDLNSFGYRGENVAVLKEYYDTYRGTIGGLVTRILESGSKAILLDVHGYLDQEDEHPDEPGIGFNCGDICMGTWDGDLVEPVMRPGLRVFKDDLRKAGFPVHPDEGFHEYGSFVGGGIVYDFRGREGVAAIQMEVPRSIRVDADQRRGLAAAAAAALIRFSDTYS